MEWSANARLPPEHAAFGFNAARHTVLFSENVKSVMASGAHEQRAPVSDFTERRAAQQELRAEGSSLCL